MTYDLSDVTFMIPFKMDSEDRIINVNIITMFLRQCFNTKIIIAEQGEESIIPKVLSKTLYDTYIYYKQRGHFFHKTRLINVMTKHAKTPIVVMHDSDILIPEQQYISAVNELRADRVDFIYPFDGRVVNISKQYIQQVFNTLRFNFIDVVYVSHNALAVGGCVMYNRNKFIEAGMMNENFVSYGPEDGEQDLRLKKLNYRTTRIGRHLYHLDHKRTEISTDTHSHTRQNLLEIDKIKRMSPNEIRHYISTWPWLK